jgi:hypothetical protein
MIKPPWAFSIWCDPDFIYAELPAINSHACHTLKLPNSLETLNKLLVLARARDAKSELGTKGDPTQAQIEKPSYDLSMVRRPKPQPTTEQRSATKDILRRLGMICLLLALCSCAVPLR